EELRSPREWSRRAAYLVLASLRPREAASVLARGLSDPSPVVRETVADALEATANRYYYHLVAARMHGDVESRRFVEGNRGVMMESLGPLLRAFPLHAKAVFLDLVIESGEAGYPLVTELLLSQAAPATYAAFIHALSTAMSEPAVELILKLLQDGRARLHDAATDALKLRRDPGFPAILATVFSKMPAEKVDALAQRTRELPWWHTVEAAPDLDPFSAGRLLDFVARSAVEPARRLKLVLSFLKSPHAEVRARVLTTLQTLAAPELQETAEAALQDPSDEVKLAAARMIIGMNPPNKARLLLPLLNAASEEVRRMAMREVASASFDKYLRSFDRLDPETREAAARALAKIDGRILERLTEEINALDAERRLKALRVIDYVDAETDLRQNLMALLNDPDRRVRATAIKIVQLSGSADGMRLLVAALADDDRRVRANAVEAFEDSGDAQCVPLLRPYLRDPDNRVRANVAKAMWNLGAEEGRAALHGMLRQPEESMRLSAVWAIGEVRFDGAADLLMAHVEGERSPLVRSKIGEVISRLARKDDPLP
ncbi:MAG: HEAT repeat domain-containing protein, partial [Planctomycetaceae bacterium]|nr:HEAT repeat domain-containing protein [Planctomycetaceae bacterium]